MIKIRIKLKGFMRSGNIAFIIVLIFIGCASESRQPQESKQVIPQAVVKQVNFDSLMVITPGKDGIPLPSKTKALTPVIKPDRLAPVIIDAPKTIRIDSTKLILHTPGGKDLPEPVVYKLPQAGFSIQIGDTISVPVSTRAIQPLPVSAQPARYKDAAALDLQYLDVEQGLPSSYLYLAFEDSRKNIWFGTYGAGVSRYDGRSFFTFSEKEGLPNNYVTTIMEDSKGNLWFGTWGGGACCYDGKQFTVYSKKQGLADNIVFSILEDSKGNIWLGTNDGITLFDGKSLTNFKYDLPAVNNMVRTIIEDREGNLWFGTDGGGLIRFDGKTFCKYTVEAGLPNDRIKILMQDRNENIWIGTWGGGIALLSGDSLSVYSQNSGLTSNMIRNLLEDKSGNIWIATWGGGVNKLVPDEMNDSGGSLLFHYNVNMGLTENIITSLMEDDSGNIWISTSGGGIIRFRINSFISYTMSDGLPQNRVRHIMKDKRGDLWFGTEGGGVSCYNGRSFKNFSNKEGLSGNFIRAVLEDKEGNYWFGTEENGLCRYDGKYFTNYTDKQGLPINYIWSILEDSNGNIWLGTYGSGAVCFDGESFTVFDEKAGLVNNIVITMLEDKKGNIWFGTEDGGISRFDGQTFTNFSRKDGLVHNSIWTMLEDSSGRIWFGTDGGGLICFNGVSFFTYDEYDGLSNNYVYSVSEEEGGNLWVGTETGLNYMKFVGGVDSSSNNGGLKPRIEFNRFGTLDGLKAADFFSNSGLVENKNLWLGSGKALINLDLEKFSFHSKPPLPKLNSIDVNEKFIDFHVLKDNPTDDDYKDVEFSEVADFYNLPLNLELPHYLNHLTFHFSAIDWASPHKIKYVYILEGQDNNWSKIINETKADYRNLSYGEYIFKIRAVGAADIWSDTFEYAFTIHPPWWLAWWAYILYAIFIAASVLLIVRFNTRRLVQQKEQLEQTVAERTTEVIQQKEEIESQHKKLVELDHFKEGMTGMILHDLKNPLNTILHSTVSNSEIKNAGNQMLNMVMNILDVQKFEDAKMVLDPAPESVLKISMDAIQQVAFLSRRKNLNIENKINPDIKANIDAGLIERVFVNLLTNAIKFSPNNEKIILTGEKASDNLIKICVIDNGPGIPAEKINSVFDKFAQVQMKDSGKARSTGLGLAFCKSAIEAHNGKIAVDLSSEAGTTFYFTLPSENELPLHQKRVDQKKIDLLIGDQDLILTADEKQKIEPIVLELKKLEHYELTKITELINKIDPGKGENLAEWKKEIETAIYSSNEDRFKHLIKIAE